MVESTGNLDGHVVQFYGHEEELTDHVAAYLLDALRDGGAAVVVAIAAHRQVFEGRPLPGPGRR